MDTPEYKTIRATTENLRLALQHHLVSIGGALVSRGVISSEQDGDLRNVMHSPAARVAMLIQWIQEEIQGGNIQIYHIFVDVLRQNPLQYSHIVSILQQKYAQCQRGMKLINTN
ncbi:MAG: hypothetical protein MJE68_15080 [Proteobacteria bacterium]|nr:hypothetical protein [Pseudomonadota bacterium]